MGLVGLRQVRWDRKARGRRCLGLLRNGDGFGVGGWGGNLALGTAVTFNLIHHTLAPLLGQQKQQTKQKTTNKQTTNTIFLITCSQMTLVLCFLSRTQIPPLSSSELFTSPTDKSCYFFGPSQGDWCGLFRKKLHFTLLVLMAAILNG